MENYQIIEPGTVIFLPGFPAYGVVAKRDNWLKWAEKENPKTVKSFLRSEKKFDMVPFLILGYYISSRIIMDENDEPEEEKYVQRWASHNFGSHISIISDPREMAKALGQFLSFRKDPYLDLVWRELSTLLDYLNNPKEYPILNLFKKALD